MFVSILLPVVLSHHLLNIVFHNYAERRLAQAGFVAMSHKPTHMTSPCCLN